MARLYIPACGDRITLTKPWQFTLYLEYRNLVYAELMGLYQRGSSILGYYGSNLKTVDHTIEAGTVLECDRVYIRASSKSASSAEDSYDSITWRVVINNKAARNQRFWAKLSDCYDLEFDPNSISRYLDRK